MSRPRAEDIEVPASAADGDVPTVAAGVLVYVTPPDMATQAELDAAIAAAIAGIAGEVLMQDGTTSPPVPLELEDGSDWLYEG